jgi:hypothetical protein
MRRLIGGFAIAAALALAAGAAAKDLPEADCGGFAMALEYSPLFVANGLMCHAGGEHLGDVEIIEARGRNNFTYLRHLTAEDSTGIPAGDLQYFADRAGPFRATERWGETVQRGVFSTRAFGALPEDRSVKGYECVVFSRYSGDGAAPETFGDEFIGYFCFESTKGPAPMESALIDDFLKRLRLAY